MDVRVGGIGIPSVSDSANGVLAPGIAHRWLNAGFSCMLPQPDSSDSSSDDENPPPVLHHDAGVTSTAGLHDEKSLLAVMDIVLHRHTNTIEVRQKDGAVVTWNKERMDRDIVQTASAVRKYEAKVRPRALCRSVWMRNAALKTTHVHDHPPPPVPVPLRPLYYLLLMTACAPT